MTNLHDSYPTYLGELTAQMPVLSAIDPARPMAVPALTAERNRAAAIQTKVTAVRDDLGVRVVAARSESNSAVSDLNTSVIIATGALRSGCGLPIGSSRTTKGLSGA